jgi:hypothetical protein
MSGLARIVASIVSIPVAFYKEVADDVKVLEAEKAKQRAAMSKMEVPQLSLEEQQMLEAMRKNKR